MPFTYRYPHPAVATDIAIFTVRARQLGLLLIKRAHAPFEGHWALPGGFLNPDEDLERCARRELREEAGVDARILFHVANFSSPDRDPRERVISIAYAALISSEELPLKAGSDAAEAGWFEMSELPALAFDHAEIVEAALVNLKARLDRLDILLGLLPSRFTLSQLQHTYEVVAGTSVEKRNFRKMALGTGAIKETEAFAEGRHRPARYWERA